MKPPLAIPFLDDEILAQNEGVGLAKPPTTRKPW
jgi:hypothetical protein